MINCLFSKFWIPHRFRSIISPHFKSFFYRAMEYHDELINLFQLMQLYLRCPHLARADIFYFSWHFQTKRIKIFAIIWFNISIANSMCTRTIFVIQINNCNFLYYFLWKVISTENSSEMFDF